MEQENNSLPTEIKQDKVHELSPVINRIMYAAFALFSVYYAIRGDWMTAASNLGIALIFDPFNQKIKWQNRPLYQRIWLIIHLSVMFTIFGLSWTGKI